MTDEAPCIRRALLVERLEMNIYRVKYGIETDKGEHLDSMLDMEAIDAYEAVKIAMQRLGSVSKITYITSTLRTHEPCFSKTIKELERLER